MDYANSAIKLGMDALMSRQAEADAGISNLGIELFSQGESATFKEIDIWEKAPKR